MVSFRQKIVPYADFARWREEFRRTGKRLVVTNGCFDLLDVGHVTYLDSARAEGDALLVGVNSDRAVLQLKGEGRPINNEEDRSAVIAGLEAVSFACVFPDVRATELLRQAQPDIYVKGGDYTLETLNQEERKVVEAAGGKIVFIPFVPGKSTTSLVQKITRL